MWAEKRTTLSSHVVHYTNELVKNRRILEELEVVQRGKEQRVNEETRSAEVFCDRVQPQRSSAEYAMVSGSVPFNLEEGTNTLLITGSTRRRAADRPSRAAKWCFGRASKDRSHGCNCCLFEGSGRSWRF